MHYNVRDELFIFLLTIGYQYVIINYGGEENRKKKSTRYHW